MSCIPAELYWGGGINLTRDSRSVSLASDAFVWLDLNQMYVRSGMLLHHCQTMQ